MIIKREKMSSIFIKKKDRIVLCSFILIAAVLLLSVSFVMASSSDEKNFFSTASDFFRNIFNKISGLVIGEDEPIVSEEQPIEEEPPLEEEVTEEIIEEMPTEMLEPPDFPDLSELELIEEELEEQNETITENETIEEELNETEEQNETIEEELNETGEQNETITENETESLDNITTEINISVESNQTAEELIGESNETNITTSESIIQYNAVIGKPVKWEKRVKVNIEGEESVESLQIEIPKEAGNISVTKSNSEGEKELEVDNEEIKIDIEPIVEGSPNLIVEIMSIFLSVTGKVVDVFESSDETLIDVNETINNEDEMIVEYYTDAPYSEEVQRRYGKDINIIGPDEIHYVNVTAFTFLETEAEKVREIRLYHITEAGKEEVEINASDTDGNGLYDYIEWTVPSLSEQNYQLILISKAEHLDENKKFIEEVYELVNNKDDNWTSAIGNNEFIRVVFESELTNIKDISIYARANESSRLEVYLENSDQLIASIDNIQEERWYKTYLTNLEGTNDSFDLKIIGSIEFDYIVDPTTCPGGMTGVGNAASPCIITNCTQLNATRDNMTAYYELANNIDCSVISNFTPIGCREGVSCTEDRPVGVGYEGVFDGNHYNISNLNISRLDVLQNYIGLFGFIESTGIVRNVHIVDANVFGYDYTGIIAGFSEGTIINCSTQGFFGGTSSICGGFAGYSNGTIFACYSNAIKTLSAHQEGGFIGKNSGSINNSYSSNCRVGTNSGNIVTGGFVGFNTGTINNSYSSCNVSGTSPGAGEVENLGGFVGHNTGTIFNSFSTGNVTQTGVETYGGFAGDNDGTITNSAWYDFPGDSVGNAIGNPAGNISYNKSDVSYFKGTVYPSNAPMSSWGFYDIWEAKTNDHPVLTWQGIGDIEGSAPTITILYPTNTTYLTNVSAINYSVTESNPSRCWYSRNLGITNSSDVSSGTNFTGVVSINNLNNWTVFCNDTGGNFGQATVYFTKTPTISNCTNITSPGVYTLTQSITTSMSKQFDCCINITVSNVTIEGAGYSLIGDNIGVNQWGIHATKVDNVTIQNITITNFGDEGSAGAIDFSYVNNSLIKNCNFSYNANGITWSVSRNFTIDNTVIYHNWANSYHELADYGIYLSDNRNVSLSGLDIDSYWMGIYFDSDNSSLYNSSVDNSTAEGIAIIGKGNIIYETNVTNGFDEGNTDAGIYLFEADNNVLLNNNVHALGVSAIVDINEAGEKNYLIYNNSYAEIEWTNTTFWNNITVVGDIIVGQTINLSEDSISVDIANLPDLNRSANVTFFNSDYDYSYPLMLRKVLSNGTECSHCYNYTYLNQSNIVINVSSWEGGGNYSVGKHVRHSTNLTLYSGWNVFSLTMERNDTLTNRTVTLEPGWNLMGYSSNLSLAQQNNIFFGGVPISTAVSNKKIGNYFSYYNSEPGVKEYEYAPLNQENLSQSRAYWVYSNETNNTNLTITGVGGSLSNQTYSWGDLMFTNGSHTYNITDAYSQGWLTSNIIRYYNASSNDGLGGWELVNILSQDISPWRGYIINLKKDNITLLRQN